MKSSVATHFSQHEIRVDTPGRAFMDLTPELRAFCAASGVRDGLLNVFVRHTSCSLLITENADPDVHGDLQRFFARLVPDGDRLYAHDAEGPDDMPAHVRSALTCVSLGVPVRGGRLALGTWQGVYLWEHRLRPHRRDVIATLVGVV